MQFCHQLINGGVADHAHNIYLQLWADTGLLGLLGLLLLVLLLLHSWQRVEMQLQPFPRRLGQAALIYTALQGCFDISLLHWPVTQVFTGVLLAIPLAASASAQGPHGGEARVEDLGG
jgi:O-antigen ligase